MYNKLTGRIVLARGFVILIMACTEILYRAGPVGHEKVTVRKYLAPYRACAENFQMLYDIRGRLSVIEPLEMQRTATSMLLSIDVTACVDVAF
jgi:hypothetical protein